MSNRIRQLRESHNLTLLNLSKKLQTEADLKLSPDAIAKYERGDREPKLETWKKLADFFDVDLLYIQGISEIKNIDNDIGGFKNSFDDLVKQVGFLAAGKKVDYNKIEFNRDLGKLTSKSLDEMMISDPDLLEWISTVISIYETLKDTSLQANMNEIMDSLLRLVQSGDSELNAMYTKADKLYWIDSAKDDLIFAINEFIEKIEKNNKESDQ